MPSQPQGKPRRSLALPGWQSTAGCDHPLSKMTDARIRMIRKSELPVKVIAKVFGVSDRTIYDIKAKRRYASVKDE
jgi:DNA invertase Pin-like site-specific DNA recombinase